MKIGELVFETAEMGVDVGNMLGEGWAQLEANKNEDGEERSSHCQSARRRK